ncbi:TlpA disulfide reductase family protein [Mucilaginibacter paludis]|uniref:Alkyl hydroperoxide reductase/ Thiol specific antioxidant/ Mal allergen n=1 Tax=Mucilaginibacter paludis DSM 18603 TaxID=714943 RepID=H1YE57_9SPHI|nr:TlpA disulfide reductase family protein [Mucilaginibacter paludis]EHQ25235.1 alkyl hydroperoxide reductase/ Thiol specific antioxidant/ Mal allergen [Mucilaginibacter paludis DSM 18603]
MKLFSILAFTALTCFTGTLFGQLRLSGDIKKLESTSQVIIQYYEGNTAKSVTVKIIGGKFTWQAPVTEAQKITMIFPGRATYIFIEPGVMTMTGSRDSVEAIKVTGSKTNDEAVAYAGMMKRIKDEEKLLSAQYHTLSGDKEVELETKLVDIAKQKNSLATNYIAAHRESAFSLNMVTEASRLGTYEDVAKMYNLLSPRIKSSSEGKRVAERLAILKRSAIGEKMMNFTQKDTSGNPVNFSAFKGKYVLVDFWASWCYPCREEIPNVIHAYNTYKDHNFTVVSISLDENDKRWLNAIAAHKMPWTQLSNLKGWDDELPVYYGIKGIPYTLLVDPQGNIIAKDLRGVTLTNKLKELFGQAN